MNKFSALYDSWEYYNLRDPHKDCVRHIDAIGLTSKLKFILYEQRDQYTVRSRIINCEYNPESEFDVNKLKWFDSHNFERHRWV